MVFLQIRTPSRSHHLVASKPSKPVCEVWRVVEWWGAGFLAHQTHVGWRVLQTGPTCALPAQPLRNTAPHVAFMHDDASLVGSGVLRWLGIYPLQRKTPFFHTLKLCFLYWCFMLGAMLVWRKRLHEKSCIPVV